MPVGFAPHNLPDGVFVDCPFGGKVSVLKLARGVGGSDTEDLLRSELGTGRPLGVAREVVTIPLRRSAPVSGIVSPPSDHVPDVVSLSSRHKMVWPNTPAPAVVALVADSLLIWDMPGRQAVGEPVGQPGAAPDAEESVSAIVACGRPDPTRTEFWSMIGSRTILVDLLPEPLLSSFGESLGSRGGSDTLPGAESTVFAREGLKGCAALFADMPSTPIGTLSGHHDLPSRCRGVGPAGVASACGASCNFTTTRRCRCRTVAWMPGWASLGVTP